MTIFIATLFLPYTIHFEDPSEQPRLASPEESRPQTANIPSPIESRTGSRGTIGASNLSLFQNETFAQQLLGTPGIAKTPGATTDHEEIFKMGNLGPGTLKNLRSISRTDLHEPGWGKAYTWNQPESRAKSPPPSSILKHNALKETAYNAMRQAQMRYKHHTRRPTGRSSDSQNRFSETFSVEQAQIGNGGLFNAIEAVTEAKILDEKTWVGTLGMPTDALSTHIKSMISEKLEDEYEALPVYVEDSDLDGHYEHYCKTILWPHFHYQIPDHPKSKAYEDHSWVYYVKVNQAFADRIAKNYKRGDIVWIHDYHLLLVPGMLRKQLPDAEIGFFLHTAFPSSEIFRCLATRRELLEGLLGANMVGFQTDEYCHHFLSTCSRLLNVEATKYGIILEDGRFVRVNRSPIGIDPKSLDHRRGLEDVGEWVETITEKYKGKRIIVARDKLDNIRGVRQKILAYELFLNKYPEYKEQVVLIQIATASTTDQADLDATISDIVTRVNSAHSTLAHQPLVYLKQDIDFSQYLALLSAAECLMITSLREGMNLTSHEFVFCQDGKYGGHKHSPLILSEFTGSGSVLGGDALLINPWDYSQVAESIKKSLDMPQAERDRRWSNLFATVNNHTAVDWYKSYMGALDQAWKDASVRDSTAVPRLSIGPLKKKYEAAGKRLMLLDYEGTLAAWGSPSDIIVTTPKRAIDALNELIADPKNTIYVTSSRTPEEMERLFREVPGLGLIAENGCFLMEAGTDDWIELTDLDKANEWKQGIVGILKYYEERVEGSRIEEHHCSLKLDYSEATDKETAFKQAGECANHINDACHNLEVRAIPVERGLYIAPAHINKASAASMISEKLQHLQTEKGVPVPDFLLVIGDSREDEYMFNWANEMQEKGVRDVCTVTLGGRNTAASATLTQGVTGVLSTLQKLASVYQP